LGSVYVENRSAQGSPTSGTDGLIILSNSGASGFNSSGALFTPSDRNSKMDFTPVDGRAVLDTLVGTPVTRWHYKNDNATWYMGPMAQDFKAGFGLGDKDTVIHSTNADGVAFAAIQGLNAKLETELATRDQLLASMEYRLTTLEAERQRAAKVGAGWGAGAGAAAIGLPALACLAIIRRRNKR